MSSSSSNSSCASVAPPVEKKPAATPPPRAEPVGFGSIFNLFSEISSAYGQFGGSAQPLNALLSYNYLSHQLKAKSPEQEVRECQEDAMRHGSEVSMPASIARKARLAMAVYESSESALSKFLHPPTFEVSRHLIFGCYAAQGVLPAHCIFHDASQRAIVLSIRGTSSMKDLLSDLAGNMVPFCGGFAHAGMSAGTKAFFQKAYSALFFSEVGPTLSRVLEQEGRAIPQQSSGGWFNIGSYLPKAVGGGGGVKIVSSDPPKQVVTGTPTAATTASATVTASGTTEDEDPTPPSASSNLASSVEQQAANSATASLGSNSSASSSVSGQSNDISPAPFPPPPLVISPSMLKTAAAQAAAGQFLWDYGLPAVLRFLLQLYPDHHFIVSGHSLGGGIATLVTCKLRDVMNKLLRWTNAGCPILPADNPPTAETLTAATTTPQNENGKSSSSAVSSPSTDAAKSSPAVSASIPPSGSGVAASSKSAAPASSSAATAAAAAAVVGGGDGSSGAGSIPSNSSSSSGGGSNASRSSLPTLTSLGILPTAAAKPPPPPKLSAEFADESLLDIARCPVPIRCVGFGVPPCVCSTLATITDLSQVDVDSLFSNAESASCRALALSLTSATMPQSEEPIVSVVIGGDDVVPRLSIENLREFHDALTTEATLGTAKQALYDSTLVPLYAASVAPVTKLVNMTLSNEAVSSAIMTVQNHPTTAHVTNAASGAYSAVTGYFWGHTVPPAPPYPEEEGSSSASSSISSSASNATAVIFPTKKNMASGKSSLAAGAKAWENRKDLEALDTLVGSFTSMSLHEGQKCLVPGMIYYFVRLEPPPRLPTGSGDGSASSALAAAAAALSAEEAAKVSEKEGGVKPSSSQQNIVSTSSSTPSASTTSSASASSSSSATDSNASASSSTAKEPPPSGKFQLFCVRACEFSSLKLSLTMLDDHKMGNTARLCEGAFLKTGEATVNDLFGAPAAS